MKNPFKLLNRIDWIIYLFSLIMVVVTSFIGPFDILNFMSTITGVTMLIFMAKGHVVGQVLSFIFAIFYSIKSFGLAYYGEVLISICLMVPLSVFSIISWARNPYKKGENVVKISKLSCGDKVLCVTLTIAVTITFYFILKAINTNNLIVSTISIFTSFCASYLLIKRSTYYAIAYTINDMVLIVLWTLATIKEISNLSVAVCFLIFLINDLYGFVLWKKREKYQGLTK